MPEALLLWIKTHRELNGSSIQTMLSLLLLIGPGLILAIPAKMNLMFTTKTHTQQ